MAGNSKKEKDIGHRAHTQSASATALAGKMGRPIKITRNAWRRCTS
jgi:hypothetical protein